MERARGLTLLKAADMVLVMPPSTTLIGISPSPPAHTPAKPNLIQATRSQGGWRALLDLSSGCPSGTATVTVFSDR